MIRITIQQRQQQHVIDFYMVTFSESSYVYIIKKEEQKNDNMQKEYSNFSISCSIELYTPIVNDESYLIKIRQIEYFSHSP